MPYIGNVLTSFAVETGNINDQAVTAPKLSATGGTDGQVLALDSNLNLEWVSDPAGQWVTSGTDLTYTAGNVGINTSSPRALVDFGPGSGDGTLSNTLSEYQAVFEGPQGTGDISRNIAFAVTTGGICAAINATDQGGSNATGLMFATGTAGSISERLRIDSDGRLLVGATSTSSVEATIQAVGNNSIQAHRGTDDSGGPIITLSKSRNTTYGSNTIVQNDDTVGNIRFRADDGGDYNSTAAIILAAVDGTPGANDMPGRLVFSTTPDGSTTPAERMRINSSGRVAIGTSTINTNSMLSVHRDTSDESQVRFTNTTTGAGGNNGFIVGIDTAERARLFNMEDGPMRFGTDNTERMRIDGDGRLLVGIDTSQNVGFAHAVQIEGTSGATSSLSAIRNSNDTNGPHIDFAKTRGTTTASNTVVQNGDDLGNLVFRGADGTDKGSIAVQIQAEVDGTPGSNDMPGRLLFMTTADGASSPTERIRITSTGLLRLMDSPGIDFSQIQTNAADMTSETLDSYEEGTFEPTFTSTNGDFTSVTYQADTGGRYIKIGSVVTINGCARCTAIDTSNRSGTDTLCIGGLPFANAARTNGDNADSIGSCRVPVWGNTNNCPHAIQARQNQTFCTLLNYEIDNITNTNVVSQANDSMMVQFTLQYRTA